MSDDDYMFFNYSRDEDDYENYIENINTPYIDTPYIDTTYINTWDLMDEADIILNRLNDYIYAHNLDMLSGNNTRYNMMNLIHSSLQ